MAGYSKVPRQLWTDGRFRALSRDARDLLLYLTTSPHSNSFGYFYLPDLYICHDLQWSEAALAAAWADLLPSGLAMCDVPSEMVMLPDALAFAPESPNVVKRWKQTLCSLPRTPLVSTLIKQARRYLAQPWQLEWLPSLETEPAEDSASEVPRPAHPEVPAKLGARVTEDMGKDAPEASASPADSLPQGLAKPLPLASPYPSPSPDPSPNPNPNPNAAATRAHAGDSVPGDITVSETGLPVATGKEHGETIPSGGLGDIVPTPCGPGDGHRVDTVSRPSQQGVAHSADTPNPSPSPNPNPNPAAAARAHPQGSVLQVTIESKTRPTPATGDDLDDRSRVSKVDNTVSTLFQQDVAHAADIVNAGPKAGTAEEGRSPPGTACRCYENIWGFLAGGQHDREVFHNLDAKYPSDWLEAAFRECADSGHTCRNFKYLQRILARWEIEGFKSPRKESRNGGVQAIGRGAHRKDRPPIRPIEFQEDGPD